MKEATALVQSVFDFAIREINALEQRIVAAEDDADAMLWEQAGQVAAQLKAGLSQRQLAKQWINARTGEPYSKTHIVVTVQAYGHFNDQPRPRFRDTYNAITNAATAGRHGHLTGDYEWYTPEPIVEAVRRVMGGIDLDPASCKQAQGIVKATQYFTEAENGLEQYWSGRVFLNPPFAHPTVKHFADKLLASGGVTEAVWLSNACVDTEWWQALARRGVVCCTLGRIKFYGPEGQLQPPTLGQTLIYLGDNREAFREAFAPFGVVLS